MYPKHRRCYDGYTVKALAKLAGVSPRTLRYYDEIGLLRPARINSSGYRIYSRQEVDLLQQIMFYRELGFSLNTIKEIITSDEFDLLAALKEHRAALLEKRARLDKLIANVEKTIMAKEGGMEMSDKEKFEGFKERLIKENKERFGDEVRGEYGEEALERSNNIFRNIKKEEYDELTKLSDEVLSTLYEAMKTGDPSSPLAQKAADLHKKWLTYCWGTYDKEAHANLAQMYVDDIRFTEYYDKGKPGPAKFLRDAVWIYTGIDKLV